MHQRQRTHLKIYRSRMHVVYTLGFIVVPFLFLFAFGQLTHIATRQLFADVAVSTGRLAVAYLIATALAWVLAVIFYRGRLSEIGLPLFDLLQSIPTFAALPLATLAFGPSTGTVIFFLVLAVIWPMFFSLISSLKLVRAEWEEVARMYQLRGFSYIRHFLWPVSIPALITGSIIGLGDGWEALIATEIIVGKTTGLGNFFQTFATNTTITTFGILGFLIFIFSINKIIWLPLLQWSHKEMEE